MILTLGMIYFNDKILPEANHRARILMAELHQKKPTLSLKENMFINEIPGYHILIKKVNPRTNEISDITIYEKVEGPFPRTILAQKGKIEFSEDRSTLILHLEKGEVHEADQNEPGRYRRVSFEKQIIYIPDVEGKLIQAGSDYRTDREMNIKMMSDQVKGIDRDIFAGADNLNRLARQKLLEVFQEKASSSSAGKSLSEREILSGLFYRNQNFSYQLQMQAQNLLSEEKDRNSYLVEIQKKYSIAFACIVFILIGAPLGIMSRRGNVAVGLGLSLVFFVLYWAFLIGGEELADRLYVSPFWAMWSANILLALVGSYILIRSTKEMTFISWKWLEKIIPKRLRKVLFGTDF